jgi:hypothetical protein
MRVGGTFKNDGALRTNRACRYRSVHQNRSMRLVAPTPLLPAVCRAAGTTAAYGEGPPVEIMTELKKRANDARFRSDDGVPKNSPSSSSRKTCWRS